MVLADIADETLVCNLRPMGAQMSICTTLNLTKFSKQSKTKIMVWRIRRSHEEKKSGRFEQRKRQDGIQALIVEVVGRRRLTHNTLKHHVVRT